MHMSKHRKKTKWPKTLSGCFYLYFELCKSYLKTNSSSIKGKLDELTAILEAAYQKQFFKK